MSDVWAHQALTRRRVTVDAVWALVFGLAMVPVHFTLGPGAVTASVLLALALLVRRVSWQAMVVLAVAASVVQVTTNSIAWLAALGYAPLFFTLGANRDRRARWVGAGCAVVAVLGAGLHAGLSLDGEIKGIERLIAAAAQGAMAAVICVGGWVWGYLRWQQQESLQTAITARIDALERRRLSELFEIEQERRRIAADMHDVVAHSWAVVAAQSDGARYALRTNPVAAERALEVIGETARAAMADLRTIVAQLRDPALAPSTPGTGQQVALLARMRESGMDVQLHETGTPDESPLVALTAYRLLGESLTNALKYGDLDAPVLVEVDWSDGYRLRVTNRIPTNSPTARLAGGHGLVGMSERAAVAGGSFTAGPQGTDWIVVAQIPTTESTPARKTPH